MAGWKRGVGARKWRLLGGQSGNEAAPRSHVPWRVAISGRAFAPGIAFIPRHGGRGSVNGQTAFQSRDREEAEFQLMIEGAVLLSAATWITDCLFHIKQVLNANNKRRLCLNLPLVRRVIR